jgi:hypothetical protein
MDINKVAFGAANKIINFYNESKSYNIINE